MIEETATVIQCEGELAWVETVRKSACEACSVKKGCGTSVLASVVGNKPTRLRVVNECHAQVGDEVTIGIHESAMLRGAMLVYMVPILVMFGFALLAELLANQLLFSSTETFVILAGLAGLVAGLLWVKRHTANFASDPRYQAVILNQPKVL